MFLTPFNKIGKRHLESDVDMWLKLRQKKVRLPSWLYIAQVQLGNLFPRVCAVLLLSTPRLDRAKNF